MDIQIPILCNVYIPGIGILVNGHTEKKKGMFRSSKKSLKIPGKSFGKGAGS